MSGITDYLAAKMLTVAAKDCWLGLMSSDPDAAADPLTVEISGSVYRRATVRWTAYPRVLVNREPLFWNGLALNTHIAAFAGFDAAYNGQMLFSQLLDVPIALPAGGRYSIDAGALYLGLDL